MYEIYDMLIDMIANYTARDVSWIGYDSTPKSLGMDSLDNVEMIMSIEDTFCIEIPDEQTYENMTVERLYNLIISYLPNDIGTFTYKKVD